MQKISEIWVINENGKPLFNKSIDNKVDPALFGGFLSAIQKFVETSFHGSSIDKLFLGESKITFLHIKEHHLYVVIRCHKKVKDKEVTKGLEKIRDLFVSTYKDRLSKDQSNVTDFQSFNKVLEENMKEDMLMTRMKSWFEGV